MKRSIIILIALVIFMAVPVLASTPEQENAPIADEEYIFLLDLTQLSEEQLINIFGLIATDNIDGTNTFNPFTQTGTTSDGKKFKIIKEWTIKKDLLFLTSSILLIMLSIFSSDIAKILQSLGIIGTVASFTITKEAITIILIGGGVILLGISLIDILENGLYIYKVIYIE